MSNDFSDDAAYKTNQPEGIPCPNCGKKMKIGKPISPGYRWYCPDYAFCGGIREVAFK